MLAASPLSVLDNQEGVRVESSMGKVSLIPHYLSGSNSRMPSFEARCCILCSRFNHCAMVTTNSGRTLSRFACRSVRCPVCPKADTTGRFMSTRPS